MELSSKPQEKENMFQMRFEEENSRKQKNGSYICKSIPKKTLVMNKQKY